MSRFRRTSDIVMNAVRHRGGKTVASKVSGMYRGAGDPYGMPPSYDAWKTTPPERPVDLERSLEEIDGRPSAIMEWLEEQWDDEADGLFKEFLSDGITRLTNMEPSIEVLDDLIDRFGFKGRGVPASIKPAFDSAVQRMANLYRDSYFESEEKRLSREYHERG